ncbi:MAG: DUF488 domain-containing protein [Gammaproteobacteria bacterium]|nr:DUF488 domain-containing protein [Gammaproteobacteria bacterium]NIR84480.1 DUF488 domain-containing protein [Gammaproteobacteria bacterium]NIR90383.1 DUF488 domain-containing protein [Gammaproteobacteria bacterium]NIU05531.1 DUF488 domain-containing protein [Gammaproteobacteria bacterium]NIV52670.1 DUF488 family protein [Gammaproteobacteria bacterium]
MAILTVGHSHRAPDDFLDLLAGAGVQVLVDVRRHPGSRRHPHFNRGNLQKALADRGIEYLWRGEAMGGRRAAIAGSGHAGLRSGVMRAYAEQMQSDAFTSTAAEVEALAASRRVALMCAERLPEHCHRSLIADFFVLKGTPVEHLIDAGFTKAHEPHPQARRRGRGVMYETRSQMALDLDG